MIADDQVTSYDLEGNGFDWYNVDRIPKIRDGEVIIINTDLSSGPGIHWVSGKRFGRDFFIVDSLGPSNFRVYDKIMLQKLKRQGLNVLFYNGKFQYGPKTMPANSACGWFAQTTATLLRQSSTIAEADKKIAKMFGRTADDGDIRKLIGIFGTTRQNA